MAGDFMYVNNTVYRPAQDCLQGYGKGIFCIKLRIFQISPIMKQK